MTVKQILTKYCTRCKKDVPITNFGIKNRNKDGLQSWCKTCRSNDAKNKTKIFEYTKTNNKNNIAENNNSPINIPVFKTSSITKHNFHEVSKIYVEKYINSKENPKETIIKENNSSDLSIDNLILEKKIELTILNHLKETGNN
jgi:hypothetical protein